MSQVVDLPSAFASSIDAGARRLELNWLEKVWSQDSRVGVEVSFLDAANVQVGVTGNAPQVRSVKVWGTKTYSLDVPALARKFRLRIRFLTAVAPYDFNKTFATGFTARLVGRLAPPSGVNLLTSVDGPFPGTSDKMLYVYNSNGSLTSVTNEIGHVTTITAFTSNGLPSSFTDPNGIITTLAYDARDRLTTVIVNPGAAQAQTTMTYDPIGQITRITQPDGTFLDYVWSDARRLTSVTNNTGEKIEYGYNLNGDVTSSTVKSPANVITKQMSMTYNELGRVMNSISAATQTTTYSYDRTDLNVQVKAPRNNLHGLSYDALQRLVQTQAQAGGEVTWNGQDALTSYKNGRGIAARDEKTARKFFGGTSTRLRTDLA
jgi:YD repeat-containing protein